MAHMRRHTARSRIYVWATRTEIAAGVAFLALTVALKSDPNKIPKQLAYLSLAITWMQGEGWLLILVVGGLAAIAKTVRTRVGRPGVWATLQAFFDQIQTQAFTICAGEPVHHHRVTLFKYRRWRFLYWPWGKGRWPLSGWLIPVLRSWHTTQITNSIFLAPDDAEKAEGIAGQTWNRNSTFVHDQGIPRLASNATDAQVADYAKRTWAPVPWVREHLKHNSSCPMTFCGIPIDVRDRRYGVIVLDSVAERNLKERNPNAPFYRLIALMTGRLIAEA